MLTPVWFILVAIAIPCQAYLDDRVLLDQHWTGFSPTVGAARREESKIPIQDRRHASARQSVNEPDKRSAGFHLRSAETGPLMVRDMRSTTVRKAETSLRFRSDNVRKPEVAERSIRHVLSDLERISRRERLNDASVPGGRTDRDASRTLCLPKQEREIGDRTIHSTNGKVSHRTDDKRRRTTAEAPTWVKGDSRRRVRSAHRDLVLSDSRLTPSRRSHCDAGASVIRKSNSVERIGHQKPIDRQAASVERLSGLTETRAQGRELDTRREARHKQDEKNHASRIVAVRPASRRQTHGKIDRNHHIHDAMYQSRLVVDQRNNLHGLAKKNSFRSKALSSRNLATGRHRMTERRRNTMLPLQASTERDRTDDGPHNEGVSSALSGLPKHEVMPPRMIPTVRTQNHRVDGDVTRNVRHTGRTETRTSELHSSFRDTRNRKVRGSRVSKRYAVGATDERRPARSLVERALPNMQEKRQGRHGNYLPLLERVRPSNGKEIMLETRHDRSFRPHDSERASYILDKSFAGPVQHKGARSVSAVRRQLGVDHEKFDWTNTRETSIQVYRARCEICNDDVASSRSVEHGRRIPTPVDSSARITKRSGNEVVLGKSIIGEGRQNARESVAQRLRYVERVVRHRELRHDSSDKQMRFVDSRERIVADTRRTNGETQLAFAKMQNARQVREDFGYKASRRSTDEHSRLKTNRNDVMFDTTISIRANREAGDNSGQHPEDARSSRIRTDRYIFERRQSDKGDIEGTVSNVRRDMPTTLLKKAPHSSRRFQNVRLADFSVQEELNYPENHQESSLYWDELASSYFRSDGSLLETVLTVGVVALMTMSPKRKLVD
ncbi:uncharacterized protein [Dermacentor albipictus]|uniref:uncharacterized protein n=1 Tax=Dermacentor albipictus TaxID=60249 RepID=UPI0038FC3EF9